VYSGHCPARGAIHPAALLPEVIRAVGQAAGAGDYQWDGNRHALRAVSICTRITTTVPVTVPVTVTGTIAVTVTFTVAVVVPFIRVGHKHGRPREGKGEARERERPFPPTRMPFSPIHISAMAEMVVTMVTITVTIRLPAPGLVCGKHTGPLLGERKEEEGYI
jgi:hypothetical protein